MNVPVSTKEDERSIFTDGQSERRFADAKIEWGYQSKCVRTQSICGNQTQINLLMVKLPLGGNGPIWMTTALMKRTWLPINPASERALSYHWLTALETSSVSHGPRQIPVKKWTLCNLVHCDTDRLETNENVSVFTWFPNRLKPFIASSAAFARPTELQGQETQRITQHAIRRFEWHCQYCKIGTISSNKYICVMKALAWTTNVLKPKRKTKHSFNCT